jgi:flagellar protein FliS
MTQNQTAYRAHQAYRGAAVAVPPLRAVVLLCNGAITCLQRSLEAQLAGRYEEGHGHMLKATAILRGLSHHLDCTRGGAVADRLYATYNALIMACLRSFGRPQLAQNYRRIIASVTELRDAWEHVAAEVARRPPAGQGRA